jgi:hypothetical protein
MEPVAQPVAKREYKPQAVEVLDVSATVTVEKFVATLQAIFQHIGQILMKMLTHPDRAQCLQLDPFHKFAICNIAVLVEETATDEQIAAGREAVLACFDSFVTVQRPNLSRIVTPQPAGGGVVLQ